MSDTKDQPEQSPEEGGDEEPENEAITQREEALRPRDTEDEGGAQE